MRVLILEDNLLWSARLAQSVRALGHEALIWSSLKPIEEPFDVAVVNLGSASIPPREAIATCKAANLPVLAHAGHKEKELHALGEELGCELLATNGEITWKLESLLAKVPIPS